MRFMLLMSILLSTAPVLANPFEDKPKEAQPDYDKVPNDVPIGLTFQVLDAEMLSAFGVQGQSVGLAITQVDQSVVDGYTEGPKVMAAGPVERPVPAVAGEGEPNLDFQTGDVITHLNGEIVKGIGHYREVVDRAKPNTEVTIRLFRDGVSKDVKLFRIHAFGLRMSGSRIHQSFFHSDLNGCYIRKYNNKREIKITDIYRAKSVVLMVECENLSPRFVKIEKKRYFGVWSFMMQEDLGYGYGGLL